MKLILKKKMTTLLYPFYDILGLTILNREIVNKIRLVPWDLCVSIRVAAQLNILGEKSPILIQSVLRKTAN